MKVFEPVLKASESRQMLAFMKDIETEFSAFARAKTGFLAQLVDYVMTGSGKRLRPALVHVASQFGPADPEGVKQVAISAEMIHIATLVHDDLIDGALLRRQKPTVAVKFGDGAAVLLGDYVYAQAFQKLAGLNNAELLRLFADTTMAMCDGEIGQVESRYQFDLTEKQYLDFLDKKTASLMAACCRAGGYLCGLNRAQQDALDRFGRLVGVAFQIVDDILDLEGEEAVTGKTLRTDLMYGKMTLPLIHYRDQLKTAAERNTFFDVLKNPNGLVSDLIGRVHDAGSMAYSREKVGRLVADALAALEKLPDHPSRRLLADITHRLSDRKV
jgi:geranylgeranyl pyrophosphate synthase